MEVASLTQVSASAMLLGMKERITKSRQTAASGSASEVAQPRQNGTSQPSARRADPGPPAIVVNGGGDRYAFTPAQLAQLLGVSLRKLERDRQQGIGIAFSKFGRRILYRRSDVQAYLAGHSYSSTAEAKRAREGS